MQRIAILGCSGGGKSTLARALGERLGLTVVHLDQLYWLPGWVERDPVSFRTLQAKALSGEGWVADGGYSSSFDLRLPHVDTVILLDQPRLVCLWRVIGRWLTHLGRTRSDMGEDCPEKMDWEFASYIWTYYKRVRSRRDTAIAAMAPHARLIRLTSDRQVRAFMSVLA